MQTYTTIAEVRAQVSAWKRAGERVAFVPTMGNLHAGHISLIERAKAHGERFVASIFVNPMQFGPNEDFNHYPRTPERDSMMLQEAGCDLLFIPDVKEMYPLGQESATRVHVPLLSEVLCGAVRPGHFVGVTSVVLRLFGIVQPDVAVFGRKDFQQLAVIRRMVSDLCLPVEIVGAATVRAEDGLALSSRNQYLSDQERATAPALYRSLQQAAEALRTCDSGDITAQRVAYIEKVARECLGAQGFSVDYFEVRDAESLLPLAERLSADHSRRRDMQVVVLVAARLGKARLIDNLEVDWMSATR
jgi:pantoate--beta-alanine ligase